MRLGDHSVVDWAIPTTDTASAISDNLILAGSLAGKYPTAGWDVLTMSPQLTR